MRIGSLLSLLFVAIVPRVATAEVLKVAIPSTTQAVLAFTIARDKGYFGAEGLDVELILMSAATALSWTRCSSILFGKA